MVLLQEIRSSVLSYIVHTVKLYRYVLCSGGKGKSMLGVCICIKQRFIKWNRTTVQDVVYHCKARTVSCYHTICPVVVMVYMSLSYCIMASVILYLFCCSKTGIYM